MEGSDNKQTKAEGIKEAFDEDRDVEIMSIGNKDKDVESVEQTPGEDESTFYETDENEEDDSGDVEDTDKPIFDGDTPSLADGAGKVPESKLQIKIY